MAASVAIERIVSTKKLTRRDAGQLVALGLAGWGVGQALQAFRPLGRDISGNGTARHILADRSSPRTGPADAELTMAVFTDYQCPACRKAYPDMKQAVAEDGHVQVLYKEWPVFGPASERAARVALAGHRQGIYPEVHEALMRHRGTLSEAALEQVVTAAGGSWERIRNDLATSGDEIDLQLALTRGQAFSLGLSGTPTYLIGDRLIEGALTSGQFGRALGRARS
jgi:protein-disulfide isomerase